MGGGDVLFSPFGVHLYEELLCRLGLQGWVGGWVEDEDVLFSPFGVHLYEELLCRLGLQGWVGGWVGGG